ncbi:MAG: hypothetical protein ACRDZZ_14725 [Ilumatobacteraceae bacterium]
MPDLTFDVDHEDEFHAARDLLIEEFEAWLEANRAPADADLAGDAGVFLDWRWSYSSGELDRYDDADVAEFLLEWCPRKVSAPPEAATGLCRSVAAFLEFMSATGRLEGGPARAARLMTLAADLAPEVYEAMGDSTKFGMAKSMFAGMDLDRLPESIDDLQAVLDQRMAEFNALPFEERRRRTDPFFTPPEPKVFELPFVHVPPDPADVARSAEAAPIVAKFDALRRHLGESGRALTQKGNLKLADARALVDLLDTGDTFDPEWGGRIEKTRSSERLRYLTFLIDWAIECRAVRRVKGRLVPVKAWASKPVVGRAERAYAALIALGPLWTFGRYSSWQDRTDQLLDDGIPHWLSMLLPANAEIPFDAYVEIALETARLEGSAYMPEWMRSSLDSSVPRGLAKIFELLVWTGVIEWDGRVRVKLEYGSTRWGDGVVRLTPFGHHVAPGQMEGAGYRLRSLPDLATAPAAELLDAVTLSGLVIGDVIERWQPDIPAAERAHLLVDAIAVAGSPEERLSGFTALGTIGPAAAAPFVRQLLDSPVAGHAALFLLQHGLATDTEVGTFLDVAPLVDLLSTVIDEPEVLCHLFSNSLQPEEAVRMIGDMWRHPQRETLPVLQALGKHLPDKHLAKAARKAAMQHRSWMASRDEPVG